MSREDLQGAPDWVDPLLQVSNEFQEQATAQLNRNLLTGLLLDYKFVHGVELQIKNPLNDIPEGVKDVRCQGLEVDSAGKTTGKFYDLDVATVRWRTIQTQPGQPQRLGVTVKFDVSHGGQLLEKHRTTDQTIANNTLTTVLWEATTNTRGSVITESSGSFSVTEAGVYLVSGQVNISGGALTAFQAWLEMGGNRFGDTGFFATTTADALVSTSWPITMAAGDSVKFVAYQANAAVANRTIIGTNTNRARVAVQRIYNATAPVGRVTLRFDGGN